MRRMFSPSHRPARSSQGEAESLLLPSSSYSSSSPSLRFWPACSCPLCRKRRSRRRRRVAFPNLRQLGLATSLYTSDNKEKFPFKRTSWSRMALIDTWTLLNPYVSTNRSFYLCPADRGPNNLFLI